MLAAVDIGGTSLRVAVGEGPLMLERAADLPTPPLLEIPNAIATALEGLDVAAVGVGIAGLVGDGALLWMPHLEGGPLPLGGVLGPDVPVAVDNDANMAGLAEARLGAGVPYRFVLTVTVGTGIGAGLTIGGHVERGRGFLGEVGHMAVESTGPQCRCGNTGCWEATASGTTLDRRANELGLGEDRPGSGARVVAAAAAGNEAATEALDDLGRSFGRGLGNLVSILDPDVIVVGGGVGAALGERLLEPARRAMMESVPGGHARESTPVLAARFGADAGLVGAALAAEEAR